MERFDFTTEDAARNVRDAVLRFPLGHTLKWSLIALSVPAAFMLVMGVLSLIILGNASDLFDPEVFDLCWYLLVVPQAGVAMFWVVKHLRSVAPR